MRLNIKIIILLLTILTLEIIMLENLIIILHSFIVSIVYDKISYKCISYRLFTNDIYNLNKTKKIQFTYNLNIAMVEITIILSKVFYKSKNN